MPPSTEETSAMPAISQARDGRARIIGIISTSGGIGKTELSMKLTQASTQSAWRCSAMRRVQSYRDLIMWPVLSGFCCETAWVAPGVKPCAESDLKSPGPLDEASALG